MVNNPMGENEDRIVDGNMYGLCPKSCLFLFGFFDAFRVDIEPYTRII